MSTKREPLLSNEQIATKCNFMCYPHESIAVRLCTSLMDMYEAARAKDAELIQLLVDAVGMIDKYAKRDTMNSEEEDVIVAKWTTALAAAEAHGFKPTEQ